MKVRLGSRVRQHARLIGGVAAAAVLLTGGGTLAATGKPLAQPQATTSGVTLEQAEAFVGVTPTRVLDTRKPGMTKFGPGETRTLSFATYVPPEATSVSLAIVSPSGATAISYFTMWPSGQERPYTSVLNPAPPFDLATSVLLRLGADHSLDVYNALGQSDLVVDLLGYFVPLSEVEGIGGGGGGSNFLVGDGAPDPSLGNDGDVYYDTVNHIFYGPKTNGDWGPGSAATGPAGPQGIAGPQGPAGADGTDGVDGAPGTPGAPGAAGADGTDGTNGSTILSGAGAPTGGADGDYFFDTTTMVLYGPKAGGVWPATGTTLQGQQGLQGAAGADGAPGAPGAPGTNGSTILSGAGAPTGGADGDYFFDTTGKVLYGPKAAGVWPAIGTTLQGTPGTPGADGADGTNGTNGSQILSGPGAPAPALGVDGDFYFDTTNKVFYGPKTAGDWGTGTSTAGPQGIQGPTGTMGPGIQAYLTANLVTAVLLGGTNIDFPDANIRTYGAGAPTYTNGTFTFPTAGTYRVQYATETTVGLLVNTQLVHNGTAVPGSQSGGLISLSSYQGQALVTVAAGDTLSLQYAGLLGAATSNHGTIMIEKVA